MNKFAKISINLFVVFVIWFTLDRITKIYFDSGQFLLGQDITNSILGIFHLTLVHNTGAAFGIFGNATIVLGIISVVVSIVLLSMLYLNIKLINDGKTKFYLTTFQIWLIAIVASGGIGNAIDRFVTGYVVDFICFDFIDFPVFNIADIGVTCGIFLFILTLIFSRYKN